MAAQPGAQSGGDRCGDTVAKALQIQPSERDLREIANGCGANWKSLLTFVGLKLTEIQEFEDKEKYLPDACFRGLVFWLNENADLAVSWNTLLKAMEMARMKSDARKWRDSIEGRAASLDKPGDAEQSGTLNDETPTPAQEEPRSNVPKLATTKAIRPSGQPSLRLAHNDPLEIEAFFGNPAPNNPSNQPSAQALLPHQRLMDKYRDRLLKVVPAKELVLKWKIYQLVSDEVCYQLQTVAPSKARDILFDYFWDHGTQQTFEKAFCQIMVKEGQEGYHQAAQLGRDMQEDLSQLSSHH